MPNSWIVCVFCGSKKLCTALVIPLICVKVPRIYKELRPRLGEMIHAVKRKSYNSTGYIFERAGKKVLLRADEVVEVNG